MTTGLQRFSEAHNPRKPTRLGQRYSSKGFLPEAGNTVVCHLDTDVSAHKAVHEARKNLQALPGADALLFTPLDSLHMTLFEGVIDTKRKNYAWPADMDLTVPVEEVTNHLLPRLQAFVPPPGFDVRVRDVHPGGLLLDGATVQDRACMRAWRDALTVPFGFRNRAHDAYQFHMTFAYPVAWLPDAVLPCWGDALADILNRLLEEMPILPLKAPAFCSFADMTHFEELVVLA